MPEAIYTKNDIINGINAIKAKLKPIYDSLSTEEKVILDLPLLEWNVGFHYGGLCVLHWLQGSGSPVGLPYDFFLKEERLKDIDKNNLAQYLSKVKYISLKNLGYVPSGSDEPFLYNPNLTTTKKASGEFENLIDNLKEKEIIGDYNGLDTGVNKKEIKFNYFNSFPIGSGTGDLDDIGAALGRFSQRCYYRAVAVKNQQGKLILEIIDVACRFFDEFSFSDNSWSLIDPSSWSGGQHLGCWKYKNSIGNSASKDNRELYVDRYAFTDDWVCLQDGDFLSLKQKVTKAFPSLIFGETFNIYSTEHRIYKDGFVDGFVFPEILII